MSVVGRLSIELRVKLNAVESELGAILSRIGTAEPTAEPLVVAHLHRLFHELEQKRTLRIDAEAQLRQWQRELQSASDAAGGDLRSRGTAQELKERAARWRRCALAAAELAYVAIDEAVFVALQAWLAERDAAEAINQDEDGRTTAGP